MPAYSFQRRFEAPILAGTKAQTIRAVGRRRHARPGDAVHLYVGMRTRQCRLLGRSPCREVALILLVLPRLRVQPYVVVRDDYGRLLNYIDTTRGLDDFARRDGFEDFGDLASFWAQHHSDVTKFEGLLIRWEPLAPTEARTAA